MVKILKLLVFFYGFSSYAQKLDLSFSNAEYPFLIGQFKALVVDGQNLISYANCPLYPRGASSHLGEFWFKSNLVSGKSSQLEYMTDSNTPERLSRVYWNNNQIKYENSIFSAFHTQSQVVFQETKFRNGEMFKKKQVFKNNFEINSNGIIETYEIQGYTTGSGVILFTGKSKFTGKTNLFVGNIQDDKLINIDLTKLDSNFYNDNISGLLSGFVNGNKNVARWSLHSVYQYDDLITAFISYQFVASSSTELKAIRINSATGSVKILNTVINTGRSGIPNKHSEIYNTNGKIFSLSESGGFVCLMQGKDKNTYVNFELNNVNDFKLINYDKNLNKINETFLKNFTFVNCITEIGNFIVVGGYTRTKGYAGFPNPMITVLKKNDLSIAYEKCIPQKNCTVDLIKSYEGSIYVAISGDFDDTSIKSLIILDKLDGSGRFENDLSGSFNGAKTSNNEEAKTNNKIQSTSVEIPNLKNYPALEEPKFDINYSKETDIYGRVREIGVDKNNNTMHIKSSSQGELYQHQVVNLNTNESILYGTPNNYIKEIGQYKKDENNTLVEAGTFFEFDKSGKLERKTVYSDNYNGKELSSRKTYSFFKDKPGLPISHTVLYDDRGYITCSETYEFYHIFGDNPLDGAKEACHYLRTKVEKKDNTEIKTEYTSPCDISHNRKNKENKNTIESRSIYDLETNKEIKSEYYDFETGKIVIE